MTAAAPSALAATDPPVDAPAVDPWLVAAGLAVVIVVALVGAVLNRCRRDGRRYPD